MHHSKEQNARMKWQKTVMEEKLFIVWIAATDTALFAT